METERIIFGCINQHESVVSFLFTNVKVPFNAKVTYFQLNIGYVPTDCNVCQNFKARAYLIMLQGNTNSKRFFDNLYGKQYATAMQSLSKEDYTSFWFNGTKNNPDSNFNSIDLLNLFDNVTSKYYGLVNDISIVIMPDVVMNNGNFFAFSRSGIVLTIAYQLKGLIYVFTIVTCIYY